MNGKGVFQVVSGVVLTLVIVAVLAGIGFGGYQFGYMQGLAQEGKIVVAAPGGGETALAPGALPALGYGYGWGYHRPFGFGFGWLSCLIPVLFVFFIFGIMRMIFFRRMMWGHHGPWGHHDGPGGEGFPPHWRDRAHSTFEDWHKEAHGEKPKPEGDK
jgi:hypothetical protein